MPRRRPTLELSADLRQTTQAPTSEVGEAITFTFAAPNPLRQFFCALVVEGVGPAKGEPLKSGDAGPIFNEESARRYRRQCSAHGLLKVRPP